MTHNFLFAGVVFSPIIPAVLIALALTSATSMLLTKLRLYQLVWRRSLVEVALFSVWLAIVTVLSPIPGTG